MQYFLDNLSLVFLEMLNYVSGRNTFPDFIYKPYDSSPMGALHLLINPFTTLMFFEKEVMALLINSGRFILSLSPRLP